jgi:hypothetical protein
MLIVPEGQQKEVLTADQNTILNANNNSKFIIEMNNLIFI